MPPSHSAPERQDRLLVSPPSSNGSTTSSSSVSPDAFEVIEDEARKQRRYRSCFNKKEDFKARADDLAARLDRLEATVAERGQELDRTRLELDSTRLELDLANVRIEAHSLELFRARGERDDTRHELDRANGRIGALEFVSWAQGLWCVSESAHARTRIATLERHAADLRNHTQRLARENGELRRRRALDDESE